MQPQPVPRPARPAPRADAAGTVRPTDAERAGLTAVRDLVSRSPGAPVAGGRSAADRLPPGGRVHRGPEADRATRLLGTTAATLGPHVVLGPGATERVLLHELAHVAQDPAPPDLTRPLRLGARGSDLEREASGGTPRSPAPAGPTGVVRRAEDVDAVEYVERLQDQIGPDLVRRLAAEVAPLPLPLGLPVQWLLGGSADLLRRVGEQLTSTGDLGAWLRWLLFPVSPYPAVDRARVMPLVPVASESNKEDVRFYETSVGPAEYFPAVAYALADLVRAEVARSVLRMVPRYLVVLQREMLALDRCDPDDELAPLPVLLTTRPVDALIEPDLAEHRVLSVDVGLLTSRPIDEQAAAAEDVRPVSFEPVGLAGLERWIRVLDPPDPTAEEVAVALYGHSAASHRLTVLGTLVGFSSAEDMLPEVQARIGYTPGEPAAATPLGELLSSPLADEARLAAAVRPPRPGATGADVLVGLAVVQALLYDVTALAARFGLGGRLRAVVDRASGRSTTLAEGDEGVAISWDGHVRDQQAVLGAAASGLAATVAHLDAMHDAATDYGAHALPSYARFALYETAEAYVSAADLSDVPSVALDRLASADRALHLLRATLVAGLLQGVQETLRQAALTTSSRDSDHAGTLLVPELQWRLDELLLRLSDVRAQLLENPQAASETVAALMQDARDLADEVQVVAVLDRLEAAWDALGAANTWMVWAAFQSGDLEALQAEADTWKEKWIDVRVAWLLGEKDEARTRARELADDEGFQSFLARVQAEITDAQKKALIAELVAVVAITLVTMGVGAYVGGFVAAGMTGSQYAARAVFVSTVAAEGVTFTTLQMLLLAPPDKRSTGDWATELAWNTATFGALRSVSMKLRAAGLMRSLSTSSQTGRFVAFGIEHSANAVALGAADIARGTAESWSRGGLTAEQVQERLEHAVVMYLVLAAVGGLARNPLQRLEVTGTRHGALFHEWNRARATLAGLGPDSPLLSDLRALQRVFEQYAEATIRLADQLLADPAALQRSGYTEGEIRSVREQAVRLLPGAEALRIASWVREIGPDHYTVPRPLIPKVLAAHSARGASVTEVRRDPVSLMGTFEVRLDGEAMRFTEVLGPGRPGESGLAGEPTKRQARIARSEARSADLFMARRYEQLAGLIDARFAAWKPVRTRHLIVGRGQGAIMAYATMPPAAGRRAPPGADVTEIPEVFAIAGGKDMWQLAGDRPAGQPASDYYSPGYHRQVAEYAVPGGGLANARDIAAANLMTAYESGFVAYDAKVVAVEKNPWPWVADSTLRVTVETRGGELRHIYTDTIDMSAGPGPARRLTDTQLAPPDRATLERTGQILYGETALTVPMAGEEVLVFGGGATGAWVVINATSRLGATRAFWVASPKKPGQVPPTVAENVRHYQRQGITLTPEDIATFSVNIGNELAFQGGNITRVPADLVAVRPGDPATPGQGGRVVVELSAGPSGPTTERVVDRVVITTGQAPSGPGGQLPLLAGVQFRMVLDGGRLVALTSVDPPGAVRLTGAAMTTLSSPAGRGRPRQPGVDDLVVEPQREQFRRLIVEQANAPSVPLPSRGAPPSIHQTGINVPRANRPDLTVPAVPDPRRRDDDTEEPP